MDLRRLIALYGVDTTGVASRDELRSVYMQARREAAGAAQSTGPQDEAPGPGPASEPAPESGAGGEPSGARPPAPAQDGAVEQEVAEREVAVPEVAERSQEDLDIEARQGGHRLGEVAPPAVAQVAQVAQGCLRAAERSRCDLATLAT